MRMHRLERPGLPTASQGGRQDHRGLSLAWPTVPTMAGVLSVQLEPPNLSCFVPLGLTASLSYPLAPLLSEAPSYCHYFL